MAARHQDLVDFLKAHAVSRGKPVKLASGATSDVYVDGKMVTLHASGMNIVADALLDELDMRGVDADAIGGLELGATPIVSGTLLRGGQRSPRREIHGFVVRKERKRHGTMKLIEGPVNEGMRVVVVDDVVTSGQSIVQAIDALRAANITVVGAIAVVDRDAGGAETLAALGVPYWPLVALTELE